VALAPFTPPTASPARRAKLLALVPQLDQHYRAKFAATGATGAALGIVMDGELVYARGFGVRDVESPAPVDVDTVFRIASLTKNVTAAAVMKLRDEGRIALDAPAARYLPELTGLTGPTRDAAPITVRHLLTNAAGLPYDDSWGPVSFGLSDPQLEAFIRKGILLAEAPDQRYTYSNLGFALLGRIVARVSGMRFRDYVSANILGPLGMTSTVWDSGEVSPSRLAIGYRRDDDQLVPEARPSGGAFDAAGGLYTSLRDYARYVALQLAAYPPRDDPEAGPLRRSTLREMHTGHRWMRWGELEDAPVAGRAVDGTFMLSSAAYGYGWVNNTTCAYEGMLQHGGYEPGYMSTVHLLPRHGIGIVVFSTTGFLGWRSIDGTLALLAEAGLLDGRSSVPTPITASQVQARETISALIEKWDQGLVDRTFDPQSLKYEWLSTLPQDLAALRLDHGPCQTDGEITALNRSQARWHLLCQRGALGIHVFLTPAVPPLIQSVQWTQEFSPDIEQLKMAQRLVDAVEHLDDQTVGTLFPPGPALVSGRMVLARIAADHNRCQVDKPVSSDGKGSAVFRVRCGEQSLELSFRLNATTRQATDLVARPPHPPGATCAP
jgi:CubicO group peptidase (beta-lactamase class C family)